MAKTKYVVLVFRSEWPGWDTVLEGVEAATPEAAIEQAAKVLEVKEGSFVAVPLSYWRSAELTPEVIETITVKFDREPRTRKAKKPEPLPA